MALKKHQILAAHDTVTKEIEVPEWGGSVFLKTLSVKEGIAFEAYKKNIEEEKVVPLYLTFAFCDAEGKRLYTEDDTDNLCEKNPAVLLRLFYEALGLNKMDQASDKAREEK